ncbi:MAG: discoidin domain-containing protein [Phycisphaerales bacterium]|nr:MAG: discoidin domain-containing protein [Phycisphaerales bacterium]
MISMLDGGTGRRGTTGSERIAMKSHCRNIAAYLTSITLIATGAVQTSAAGGESSVLTSEQIEADWFRQEQLFGDQSAMGGGPVKPEEDAVGACDGIKNGEWGFHTEYEDNPWWQVDLGESMSLDRVAIYNRSDFADRASRLIVLLADQTKNFTKVYEHDGRAFFGFADQKPLTVKLAGAEARYLRLKLPVRSYFHLDEVEIYASGGARNIALHKPATQSSTSQWSVRHRRERRYNFAKVVQRGLKLAENLRHLGADEDGQLRTLRSIGKRGDKLTEDASEELRRDLYLQARRAVREMALANPLVDFEAILFVKRAPGTLPHMSDQYYGWWSRPGGGIYLLERFRGSSPRLRCLTEDWPPGSFLRPDISHDAKRVLFAYCRYYARVAGMEKVDKEKLPEDAFYQIFEMNIDGTGCRQLTRGRYDDFDARYLPNGEIMFLSTRKGQFVQCTKPNASATTRATLPDSYVRCGGDNTRPCAVFTLHAMDSDGSDIRPLSAFENFEWTPSLANDGRILYARWDYIDRFNGHFMSLWSTNQDGTNPQLVYGNFTTRPQCIFEARAIPNSEKLIFTASAHHSITGGSLALLDRSFGTEGAMPLTRITPEVCFPEAEGWPDMYYANPYPLSEDYYLVAWSDRRLPPHRGSGQVTDDNNPTNALGLYLLDSFGNLELIYRDKDISSMYPIPVRARAKPPAQPSGTDWDGVQEGLFMVQDVYLGLRGIERGSVTDLRIIGVPPKTQPHMDSPSLGVSKEDPGKFVLGTVPVEADGSAYFRVPSGVPLFFQALDRDGLAVQTMRSLTYVQPGQTLSCIGCHEQRQLTPAVSGNPLAVLRGPSKIVPGPPGSWPLRFDQLVQPVLDRLCISCHGPDSGSERAAGLDLTGQNSYKSLMSFADSDLEKLAFERDISVVGDCTARKSKLLALLTDGVGHKDVHLDPDSLDRMVTWMDVYAQRLGSFSEHQEQRLRELRQRMSALLAE